MDWHAEWTKAQHDLSVASRKSQHWQTLSGERRHMLGRNGYRAKCKEARLAVKVADQRCRSLIGVKRQSAGELSRKLLDA